MVDKFTPVFILSFNWQKDLEILFNKFQSHGITYDIANMDLIEHWGTYLYLKGLKR